MGEANLTIELFGCSTTLLFNKRKDLKGNALKLPTKGYVKCSVFEYCGCKAYFIFMSVHF